MAELRTALEKYMAHRVGIAAQFVVQWHTCMTKILQSCMPKLLERV